MLPDLTPDQAAAFWRRTHESGSCLLWTGHLNVNGYGVFSVGGHPYPAHRFAYTLGRGPIPAGLFVRHRCDIRSCVRLEHLELGTAGDNRRDAFARGRVPRPGARPDDQFTSVRQERFWADPTPEERFWDRLDRSGACWVWTGCRSRAGYGQLVIDGRVVLTHRLAHELFHGPIPPGLFVLHACDNPPCCNPAHLRAGSALDNARDGQERGRIPQRDPDRPPRWYPLRGPNLGERHPMAKLGDTDVRAIRARYAAGGIGTPRLARQYGVSQATVWNIVRRRTWAHLD